MPGLLEGIKLKTLESPSGTSSIEKCKQLQKVSEKFGKKTRVLKKESKIVERGGWN